MKLRQVKAEKHKTLEERYKFWKRNYFLLIIAFSTWLLTPIFIIYRYGVGAGMKTMITTYVFLVFFGILFRRKADRKDKEFEESKGIVMPVKKKFSARGYFGKGVIIFFQGLRILLIYMLYKIWVMY